jgi:hypothetical protein
MVSRHFLPVLLCSCVVRFITMPPYRRINTGLSLTEQHRLGWYIITLAVVFFVVEVYVLFVSKLMPDTGLVVLDAIKYVCVCVNGRVMWQPPLRLILLAVD